MLACRILPRIIWGVVKLQLKYYQIALNIAFQHFYPLWVVVKMLSGGWSRPLLTSVGRTLSCNMARPLWLPVFRSSFEAKPIPFIVRGDHSSFSSETYLARGKTQKDGFLSTSATLASPECSLCFSVTYNFWKDSFFHAARRTSNYCSTIMPTN